MIKIRKEPLTNAFKQQILEGFSRHARHMTGIDGKQENTAFLAFDQEKMVGAIVVENFWGALHIKYVYVEDAYRGKRIGSDLMEKAFTFAKEQNCSFAFVETMNFQAPLFYQKLGFVLEFTRAGYQNATSFHYLRKDFT